MKFDPEILRTDKSQQELLKRLLQSGRRIIFKFVNDEDKADFLDNVGNVTGTLGFLGGAAVGAKAGGAIGGPTGAVVGGIVGGVIGGIAGYSLGAWLAHFLYDLLGDNVITKELFSWFGFLPNRVSIKKA